MKDAASKRTAKLLALAVIWAGIAVVIGWLLDISVLLSIRSGWMNMKFNTAVAFILSGTILYLIVRSREGQADKAQVVIPIISFIIILLMGTSFLSAVFGIRTGIDGIFIEDTHPAPTTVVSGRPSLPTMLNFLLIAAGGLLSAAGAEKIRLQLRLIGLTVAVIGAVPVIGYILNLPMLYYYIKDINSAIAFNTAFLFILLGVGLACL
jgi:hypothetical protein